MAIIPVKDLTTEDILYGDRNTQYRWEVLEHSNGVDHLVGTLDGVSDGSLSWVQNAAVKGRGKMEVIDLPAAQPGMLRIGELALESARIRPVMTINGQDKKGSYQEVWTEVRRNRLTTPLHSSIATVWSGAAWGSVAGGMQATVGPLSADSSFLYMFYPTPLASGQTMGSARFKVTLDASAPVAVTLKAQIHWGEAAGWTNAGDFVTIQPGETKDVFVEGSVAPAGATYFRPTLRTGYTIAAASLIKVHDGTVFESAPTAGPIFTGSTASPVPYRQYSWAGVANTSESIEEIRTQQWVSTTDSIITEIPWGTFLLEKASEEWEDTGRIWKLSLLDRTTVPSQDVVDQSYTVAAGTNILQEVRSILASSGEHMTVDQSVDLATRSGMVWEAGTSKLKIINDLLDVAGYNSLWMDGWGNFQVTPRVLPANRSIEYELLTGMNRELVDGSKSIYSSDWTRERDSFGVPNKVIAIQSAGGEDEQALVGQWTNEDPTSPYSYPSRGRWVPWVLDSVDCPEGTEAEIIEFLNNRARATLVQMSAVQAEVKVEHLPIPVRVGDVLRFANTRAGIDARHIITRLDLDTSPTGLMKSTLQEVISL